MAALIARASEEPAAALSSSLPPPRGGEAWPALWIEGGAVLGRGLDPGPVSFGGFLRGGYAFQSLPVFLGAGASYTAAGKGPVGLEAMFTTFSLGAGAVVRVPAAALAIRPRLDALLSQVVVEQSRAGPAVVTSGSRRLGGFGAAVETAWPATARLSLVLGAEGAFLSGATAIRLGDAHVAASPALTYQFLLGIQGTVLP